MTKSSWVWVKDEMGGEFCIENNKLSEFLQAQVNEADEVTDAGKRKKRKKRGKRGDSHIVDPRALQKFADNYQNQAQKSVTYYKKINDAPHLSELTSPLIGLGILGAGVLILFFALQSLMGGCWAF